MPKGTTTKVRFQPDEWGFDELVVEGVRSIHFERMDKGVMWCGVVDKDGKRHVINFTVKGGAILGTYEVE